jgi:hypothetical protein
VSGIAARVAAMAFPHGTRASYVKGCHCAECRAANVRAYHERQARAREAAAALDVAAPPATASKLWTAPDGTKRTRIYAHACPGINGQPCPASSHLRKDSGPVCAACRDRLVWNGLVSAEKARAHLRRLSRAGIGINAVAAASDLPRSTLAEIRAGRKDLVRARTERKILAVDASCRSDSSFVSAARTWRLIRLLLEEGFTKKELARRMGFAAPAIQFRKTRVLARTEQRVKRLFREATT